MKLFKLTEQDGTTYNHSTLWGENITHERPEKENPQLCSSDVLHAYSNINLAFLLNPIHANITKPLLWQANGVVVTKDFGKVGCFALTTIKYISYPAWVGHEKENLVRIMFAVLCAEAVLEHFVVQYNDDNKVINAIQAAKYYLKNPTKEAADAAADAARAAARAAAYAARAAAYAAYAAAYAARAAAYAAYAAAYAASTSKETDFGKLANKAVKLIMG